MSCILASNLFRLWFRGRWIVMDSYCCLPTASFRMVNANVVCVCILNIVRSHRSAFEWNEWWRWQRWPAGIRHQHRFAFTITTVCVYVYLTVCVYHPIILLCSTCITFAWLSDLFCPAFSVLFVQHFLRTSTVPSHQQHHKQT